MATQLQETFQQCLKCNKTFELEYELTMHNQLHTGQRVFTCIFCEKTYNQYKGLRDHIKCNSAEKPYNCVLCAKSFKFKGCLKSHKCNKVCKTLFTQKDELISHLKLHAQEREQTVTCSKSFTESSQIFSQKKTHNQTSMPNPHAQEREQTVTCSKSFTESTQIFSQKETQHKQTSMRKLCVGNLADGRKIFEYQGKDINSQISVDSELNKPRPSDIHSGETPFAINIKIEDDL